MLHLIVLPSNTLPWLADKAALVKVELKLSTTTIGSGISFIVATSTPLYLNLEFNTEGLVLTSIPLSVK